MTTLTELNAKNTAASNVATGGDHKTSKQAHSKHGSSPSKTNAQKLQQILNQQKIAQAKTLHGVTDKNAPALSQKVDSCFIPTLLTYQGESDSQAEQILGSIMHKLGSQHVSTTNAFSDSSPIANINFAIDYRVNMVQVLAYFIETILPAVLATISKQSQVEAKLAQEGFQAFTIGNQASLQEASQSQAALKSSAWQDLWGSIANTAFSAGGLGSEVYSSMSMNNSADQQQALANAEDRRALESNQAEKTISDLDERYGLDKTNGDQFDKMTTNHDGYTQHTDEIDDLNDQNQKNAKETVDAVRKKLVNNTSKKLDVRSTLAGVRNSLQNNTSSVGLDGEGKTPAVPEKADTTGSDSYTLNAVAGASATITVTPPNAPATSSSAGATATTTNPTAADPATTTNNAATTSSVHTASSTKKWLGYDDTGNTDASDDGLLNALFAAPSTTPTATATSPSSGATTTAPAATGSQMIRTLKQGNDLVVSGEKELTDANGQTVKQKVNYVLLRVKEDTQGAATQGGNAAPNTTEDNVFAVYEVSYDPSGNKVDNTVLRGRVKLDAESAKKYTNQFEQDSVRYREEYASIVNKRESDFADKGQALKENLITNYKKFNTAKAEATRVKEYIEGTRDIFGPYGSLTRRVNIMAELARAREAVARALSMSAQSVGGLSSGVAHLRAAAQNAYSQYLTALAKVSSDSGDATKRLMDSLQSNLANIRSQLTQEFAQILSNTYAAMQQATAIASRH